MNYIDLSDRELQDHLRQIEAILKVRQAFEAPVPLKVLLIADSDFHILNLMEETFNIGYNIITATTAMLALKAALARPPDIAIIEWDLNGEPGSVLSWQLHELYPRLPIIILSEHDISQADAQDIGAKLAVKKPYSPMGLADTMRHLLEEVKDEVQRL